MRNLFQFVALRHLQLRPGRALFAISGIACGIALFVAISVINDSTSRFFKDSMSAVTGNASITVSAGEFGFDETVAERLEAVSGVEHAVPVVETRSWLLPSNESLMVMGVDLLQEKAVRSYKSEGKKIIGDAMMFMARPDSIILTEPFAKARGLKMDDPIELTTARGRGRFVVRGILAPTGLAQAYGGGLAIMDIDAARLSFGKEGKTDRIDIVTKKGADVESVVAALKTQLGPSFSVERPEMASKEMERMTRSFQFMSHFFSTLALIVGVFLIANCVSISVAERRKEIGTLRALGTKRGGILTVFLLEALAMGAIGAAAGALLGRFLAGFLVDAVTQAMSQQYQSKIESANLQFTSAHFGYALLVGAVATCVAALFPALKATRVEPIEAMRSKDTGEAAVKNGYYRYAGWLGTALVALSVTGSFRLTPESPGSLQILIQLGAIVGAALIGPRIVIAVARLIRPFIARRDGVIARLAIDNMLRNPRRTATNVTSLMVGLILVVVIACVNVSFKGTLVRFFNKILHADLIISTTGRLQSHENMALHESVKQRIEANSKVLGAYELREIKLLFEGDKLLLKYFGEPPAPTQPSAKRYDIFDTTDRDSEAAGLELFHSKDPTVLVSENFVVRFKKKTGDTISLMTPQGPKPFRIVAVVNEYANPFGTIFMSRESYLKFWDDRLVSGFAVKLKDGFDPIEVRTELDRALSKEYKLTIMSNADIKGQINSVIDSSFAYTHAVEVAALLVGLLGLMNTLLITVLERTRELGLSRAIGMSRSQVSRMILLEAASQGGLGAVVALALGVGIGIVWVTQNLANSLGWVVHFYFPWNALATTLVLGLIVTMIAAWYPARRASRLDIVDALDYE